MNYGLPYMGSKNSIAKKIIDVLPPATHFYDLFAGGCAIAHAALLSGKYKYIHINDLSDVVRLFNDAVNGEFRDEKRWISRDDFFALKDNEPYVRYCWSFGNNGKDYLYSREIEPYKKAYYEFAVFANAEPLKEYGFDLSEYTSLPTSKERRLSLRQYLTTLDFVEKKGSHWYYKPSELAKHKGFNQNTMLDCLQSLQNLESLQSLQSLQNLERLQSLQSLERLERLQSLERLEIKDRLITTQLDYRNVQIESDSVIYCDIPYKNTGEYVHGSFDHASFYEWAENQQNIYISEYDAPLDRFSIIVEFDKRQLLNGKGADKLVKERLFAPKNQVANYKMQQNEQLSMF